MLKMMDRPRLKDVAQLAGVGRMTVSRVLNGGSVGPETMARVHDAMHRLHYRPDQLARSLRTRRTRMLGLVIPRLSDPFFAAIADSVNKVALLKEYALLSATTYGDVDLELKAIREMLSRRVEGILHVPSVGFSAGSIGRELDEIKLIAIDRPLPGSRADLICVDNVDGASKAVKHLISHGHFRIACVSDSNSLYATRERQEGYFNVMAEHGLRPSSFSQSGRQNATILIRKLLKEREAPSAIFTTDLHATMYVLSALGNLGIKIPDDVAMLGFDDFDSANLLPVAMSAVRQPAREMGRAAAERIIEQLQTEINNPNPQILKFSAELVLRQSCGCKPQPRIYPHPGTHV
jgi:LacI family transcriptional regulator